MLLPLVDISIHSRDICSQTRKLSLPSQILRGR